jgi:hypothetical protein
MDGGMVGEWSVGKEMEEIGREIVQVLFWHFLINI